MSRSSLTTATEVLDLFERQARPWLNVFEKNTCIEQTRVLIECLKAFGVRARPVGAKLHVVCPARGMQFVTGIAAEEAARGKKIAKSWIERKPPDNKHHVVALVEDHILVDLTVAQASSPESNFLIEPRMLAAPSPEPIVIAPDSHWRIKANAALDDGTKFTIEWILTADEDWLDTLAWEPSHLWPLIHRIVHEMRKRDKCS